MTTPLPNELEKNDIKDVKVEDVNALTHEVEEDEEEFEFTFGKALAVFSFFLGYLADVFSLTLSSAILTTINNDIGPSPNYAWIITSRLIVIAVMSPMVGRLSDIFGRRPCFLIGGVLGVIGSAISAGAKDINTMIGGGVIIGLSAAMHQLAWAALGEVVPKRTRPLAFGIMQSGLALASAFSAPMANALVIHTGTWRFSYWLPLIVNGLALILVFFFYRPMNQYIREEGKTQWQQAADLDWLGFFLLTAGLTLFLLGITFGGHRFPWVSAGTISMIVIGFFTLVVLGFYESYHEMLFPIFPPEIFRNIRGFTVVNVGIFLYGSLYYSSNVLWPQIVASLFEKDPIKIGFYTSAISMSGLIFGALSGFIFRKVGHARWFFTTSIAALTLVSGCMALINPSFKVEATVLICLVGGMVATAVVASQTMIQLGVRHEYLGVASAIANTSRNLGGSVGTTIYTSIFADKLAHYVKPDVAIPLAHAGVPPKEIAGVLTALLTHKATSPALAALTPAQLEVAKTGLKWAHVHSFRIVYLVSIAFGVVATVAVAFSANVDKQMTKDVDIKLEEGAHIHATTDTGEGHIIKRVH